MVAAGWDSLKASRASSGMKGSSSSSPRGARSSHSGTLTWLAAAVVVPSIISSAPSARTASSETTLRPSSPRS